MAAAVLGLASPRPAGGERRHGGQDLAGLHAAVDGHAGALPLNRRRNYRELDEDDVRVRPGRGSRPRTRRRPAHSDAAGGFVTAVDRGRYACLVDDLVVTAMRARELGRKSVVVGDRVALAGDVSGAPDALARIVRVEPRTSVLRRSPDDTDPVERVVVANAQQLVIVSALADPEPRPRFIDRCLVAAYDAGLAPVLCLTKADLADPGELLRAYEPLGLTCVVTRKPFGIKELGTLAAACSPTRSASSSGTQGSASPPWSTPSCRPLSGRSGGSILSPGGAGTPPHRPSRSRWPPVAGSSTRQACAGSASATSPPTGSSARSPTWNPAPRNARSNAPICRMTAASMAGCKSQRSDSDRARLAARLDSLRRLLRSREDAEDS